MCTFAHFLRFVLMTFLAFTHKSQPSVVWKGATVCHKACEYDLALRTTCTHSAMQSTHTHSWCSTASKGVQTTSDTPRGKMVSTNAQVQSKGLRIARLRGLESVARSREEDFFFLFSSRTKCPGMKWFRNNVVKRQSRQWNALSQQTTQPVHLWKQSCAKQLLFSFF